MCLDLDLQPMDCPSSVRAGYCAKSLEMPSGDSVPEECEVYYPDDGSDTSGSSGAKGRKLSVISAIVLALLF